jgi:hypothetical protein
MFLLWTVPMLQRGLKGILNPETIPRLDKSFSASESLGQFEKLWEKEVQKKDPSLLRVLTKLPLGINLWIASLFGVIQGLMMTVLRPIVLKKIIELCSTPEDNHMETIIWLIVFIVDIAFETMFLTWVQHAFSEQYGTSMIATLGIIVQNKSIKLAPGQGGNEAGLVGGDVIRQFHFLLQVGLLPSSFAALIAGMIMLFVLIGWQGMVGFVFMVMVSGFCFTLSLNSKKQMRKYSVVNAYVLLPFSLMIVVVRLLITWLFLFYIIFAGFARRQTSGSR